MKRQTVGAQIWLLRIVVSITLVIALLNTYWVFDNRGMRLEILDRQEFVKQTVPLDKINAEVIQAVANMAAARKDANLADILTRQGIEFGAGKKTMSVGQDSLKLSRAPAPQASNLKFPILVMAVSLLLIVIGQTPALWDERLRLKSAYEDLRPTYEQAQKLRGQLNTIATETALLAEQGNPNAKVLLERMRGLGLKISRPNSDGL